MDQPLAEPSPLDAVTRLLSDLVAIPSVNPMGRGLDRTGVPRGEGVPTTSKVGSARSGVDVERQVVSPGRANVIARYESPKSRRTLLFDAHQDTVPTDGMTINPFVPELKRGSALRVGGRATSKGGWRRCSPRSPAWSRSAPPIRPA